MLAEKLRRARAALHEHLGLTHDEAMREARRLAAAAVSRPPSWIFAHDDAPLEGEASARFDALLVRRLQGWPLAYVLGEVEFFGLPLTVTPAVLIPRPDTETLVEHALAHLPQEAPWWVLDLGTGSGAIALALKAERPRAEVVAVERSLAALAVARENGRRLGLPVHWLAGDWYAPLARRRFHLIVGNPPYVAQHDPHLTALRHEPMEALVSGPEGLDALDELIADAPRHLLPGGWLWLEHGYDQAEACRQRLAARGFEAIATVPDLGGRPRVSGGRWPA